MKSRAKIFRLNSRPEGSKPHEDHHTRLVEYDDWMRQEERKYTRLLAELNRFRWLARTNIESLRGHNIISFSMAGSKKDVHKKIVYILHLEKHNRNGK